MNHAIKAAVLSSCAFFLVAAVPAHADPGFANGEPNARLMQLVRKANLTSQQETQIHSILMAARAQRRTLATQGSALHQQIADKLLGASAPTLADFSALTQQIEQVHAQQMKLGLQTALQIRALLTPAQVSHVAQLHQQLSSLDAQRQAVLQDDEMEVPAPTEIERR